MMNKPKVRPVLPPPSAVLPPVLMAVRTPAVFQPVKEEPRDDLQGQLPQGTPVGIAEPSQAHLAQPNTPPEVAGGEQQHQQHPLRDFLDQVGTILMHTSSVSAETEALVKKELEKYQNQLGEIRAMRDAEQWLAGLYSHLKNATNPWNARHLIQDYVARYVKSGESAKRQRTS
jgi:hypothetical protein